MKKVSIILLLCCSLILCLLLVSTQPAMALSEYNPDSNTALLEHFNGSNSATDTFGTINYVYSLPGLNQAADFSSGWLRYDLPGWYQWETYFNPVGKQGTIEFWVYPTEYGKSIFQINWQSSTDPIGGHIFNMYIDNEGKVHAVPWCCIYGGSYTVIELPESNATIPLNQWTHLAYTWSINGTKLYINGVEDVSSPTNLYPAFNGMNYVYVPHWTLNNEFIDELLISKVAKSSFDVGYAPVNAAPVIDSDVSNVTVDEGQQATNTGTWSDANVNDNVTLSTGPIGSVSKLGTNDNGTWSWTFDTVDNLATQTISVEANDGVISSTTSFNLTVNNVAPSVTSIVGPLEPVKVGEEVSFTATFTDPGINDVHSAEWDYGNGTVVAGTVDEISDSVIGTYTYTTPGVYTVKLKVADTDGGSDEMVYDQYMVVYDPSAGFVTGGGWIDSQAGAYLDNPSLTGKADFGFVSKYQKGATAPTGQTEFLFKVAELDFHSSSYDWLVIAGTKAQYKGSGTINGAGDYGFMLTAVDGDLKEKANLDTFRIKIWDKATDTIIYDNQMGDDDDAEPATTIGGGSIVVHKAK